MRLILFLFTIIFSQSTFGQIVNSLSANNSGMFYYAVDTLIQTISPDETINRIILGADKSSIQNFPDLIRDFKIIKQSKVKTYKKKDFHKNDLLFRISGLSIIRDQITMTIWTTKKTDSGVKIFSEGIYVFYFKYLPETMTYKLREIKSGIIL